MSAQVIETGVDKLVSLIKNNGKLAFADAAKALGVSEEVIGEWADFLEDENIVGVEYKLTKPYLVEKKMSKKEVETKAKEFSDKKDIFVRKAEGAVNFLEREEKNMRKVKEEFDKLKGELGLELDSVRKEMEEIEAFEQKKRDIANSVDGEKGKSQDKLKELAAVIEREQRRYEQLVTEIVDEEKNLEKEEDLTKKLRKTEDEAKAEIDHAKKLVLDVEVKIKASEDGISQSEQHIKKLHTLAEDVHKELDKDRKLIDPLLRQKEEHELLLRELKKKLLAKTATKKKTNKSDVTKKLKQFMDSKMAAVNLVDKLNKDRAMLQKELEALIKKAKAFQLSTKSSNIAKEIKALEAQFDSVDKKRGVFEQEFKKLRGIMHI